jgi:hypothetical protein
MNGEFDPGDPSGAPLLTVDGFDGVQTLNLEVHGPPFDRAVGVHVLGDYRRLNALQMAPGSRDPVRIVAPAGRYAALRFLVAAGWRAAEAPIGIEYADGSRDEGTLPFDDLLSDLAPPRARLLDPSRAKFEGASTRANLFAVTGTRL